VVKWGKLENVNVFHRNDGLSMRRDPHPLSETGTGKQSNPSVGRFCALIFVSTLVLLVIFPMTALAASGTSPSFVLSAAPSRLMLTQDSFRISIINVTGINGFDGTVDLSVSQSAGITLTPNPVTLSIHSSSPTLTSTLTVKASSSAPLGAHPVLITASAQGGSQTENLTLMVIVVANTQVACGSFGTCLILSDASITGPSYSSGIIHFTADGPSGTSGFANVTIPRTATSNVNSTHVVVNGVALSGGSVAIAGNGIDYFIFFTFNFQTPVNVDIQLSQLNHSSNLFGVSPVIIYAGAIAFATIIVGFVAILVHRRKKRRATISSDSSSEIITQPLSPATERDPACTALHSLVNVPFITKTSTLLGT
jgi:hypothetical protein